jgi:DNA-binding response OmpR family regulator
VLRRSHRAAPHRNPQIFLSRARHGRRAAARPGRRELAVDSRTVALTRLESDLLGHLQRRAPEAVPRAELLAEVWGDHWQGGGNVIEVAVSSVRRKLGDDAALVETVRGIGYRWREP